MSAPIISFSNVGLKFGSQTVHRQITFDIHGSEILTIIGPSGTGKTVLLKMIIGLLEPTSGLVTVFGEPVPLSDEEKLLKLRRSVGMLFQGAALFDSLNVFENIAYGLRESGQNDQQELEKIVKTQLALVNLTGIEHKYPGQLSGGQRKRVGLARALASKPKIMLFDEPTTGLDPTSVRLIDDLMIELRERFKITSVVVTHDMESAKRISDRWVLLNNGSVVSSGSVNELLAKDENVKAFAEGRWHEHSLDF